MCHCHDHGHHHHHHDDCCSGHRRGFHDERRDERTGSDFDEKRFVDLIVRLVSEHVEAIVAREMERLRRDLAGSGGGASPPGGG
jgi:hypothetical protein